MYKVTNPATGEVLETFPTATDTELSEAVDRADSAYQSWRTTALTDRVRVLRRTAELFTERTEELAEIITLEMGKRIDESRGEMTIVADIFNYYADQATALLADTDLEIQGGKALVQKRPIGAILGIMPWNYPYYQVARFVAPNLVLGNTVLLKHAPNCPRSAAAIEKILVDAGAPDGAYVNIYATNEQVERVLNDPRVQGVSLTGSERAGEAVAAIAGRNLKRAVLELGGSDPMILLDTPDLEATAESIVRTRMSNMGQACTSPKRLIVMDSLYESFMGKVTEVMGTYVAGDPMDPATTLAPVSSEAAARELVDQIQETVAQGATLITGGSRVKRPGAYVEPTVLTDVKPGMRAYSQELFGPVVVVYRVSSEEEAVRLANDTPYGLGSSVFTQDLDKAARVAEQIDAGMVFFNRAAGSQADLPFGGVKRSGLGRELGPLGIEGFMNEKIIRLSSE